MEGKLKTKKIICLIAKTSCGKDTILREILKINRNIKVATSTTSRPKRSNEIEGREYFFVTNDLFNEMLVNESFVETRKYKTQNGIWQYGLTKEAIDTEDTYICIVDYEGFCNLINTLGKEKVRGIYIIADMKERTNRAFNREELIRDEQYLEIFRRFLVDEEDFPMEQISRECVVLKNNDEKDFEFCVNYINDLINKQNIEDLI